MCAICDQYYLNRTPIAVKLNSSPLARKAAAALSVQVGSYADPPVAGDNFYLLFSTFHIISYSFYIIRNSNIRTYPKLIEGCAHFLEVSVLLQYR